MTPQPKGRVPLALAHPSYRQPGVVTHGSGSLRAIAQKRPPGSTAFFMSGHATVRGAVEAAFKRRGLTLDTDSVIVKPRGEPDDHMVSWGAEFLSGRGFTQIVGIGGGSVMDWCRLSWAVSAGLLSLRTGRMAQRPAGVGRPEIWLVPTTCATGAEAAAIAVYSVDGHKVPVLSPDFVADHVVLDGRFLARLEDADLAEFLSDAISHAVEGYSSIVPSTLAKQSAVSALRLIFEWWPQAPSPHRNQSLMEAAYLAGVAASNCSVGIVHAFAHTIAAYGVGHAVGNAAGLLAGIATNAAAPALPELAAMCGLPGVDALASRIAPIVNLALDETERMAIGHVLQDPGRRRDVAVRMSVDGCLRSNPLPVDETGIDAFLTRVVHGVAQ
jgi:alcohol dehydrogenase class IV